MTTTAWVLIEIATGLAFLAVVWRLIGRSMDRRERGYYTRD